METDMPNPTNFIGQCISYRIDPGQANVATGALAPKTGMTSAANVRIGNDPRNLIGGTPWNFTFLKYSAGDVTTCPLNGNAMTGPFSGCYAFTYSSNGQQTLAHVGTAHNAEDAGSVRAKQVWQGIVLGGATNIKGESPAKQFTVSEQQKVGSENRNQLPIVCSYYEGGNAWAILFVPAVAGVTPIQGVLRIAMAKPMPQLDWNLVKAMREFR
jgi:hypothetical protein